MGRRSINTEEFVPEDVVAELYKNNHSSSQHFSESQTSGDNVVDDDDKNSERTSTNQNIFSAVCRRTGRQPRQPRSQQPASNPGEMRKGRPIRPSLIGQQRAAPPPELNRPQQGSSSSTTPGRNAAVHAGAFRVTRISTLNPYEEEEDDEEVVMEEGNSNRQQSNATLILEAVKVETDRANEDTSATAEGEGGDTPIEIATVQAEKDSICAFVKRSKNAKIALFVGLVVIVALAVGISVALFNKSIIVETGSPTTAPTSPQFFDQLWWEDGRVEDGRYGLALSLSGDGSRMAVADIERVFIYEMQQRQDENGSATTAVDWELSDAIPFPPGATIGQEDYKNEVVLDSVQIHMSEDGNRIAIGWPYSPNEDGSKHGAGCVRVYKYPESGGGQWEPVGNTLYGTSSEDLFGTSVTLDEHGEFLGVVSAGKSGNAHVFELDCDDNFWTEYGDLSALLGSTLSVGSISMSSTGQMVAVGGYPLMHVEGNPASAAAAVRVFGFVAGSWVEKGNGIIGSSTETIYIAELSGNGRVVAMSNYYMEEVSPTKDSLNAALDVRVFRWLDDSEWVQLGENIHAFEPGEKSGYFISLSDDGRTMFMGDPGRRSEVGGGNAGHVHIYQYNDDTRWEQLGPNRDGDSPGDQFGSAVAVSGDGKIIAASAPYNRQEGTELGRLYAFSIGS